jgi:histidinol-phosphate/aromatic aminotransferase/cobyric acid decarboxylase-like protein
MSALTVHGGDGARLARALGVRPGDVLDLSASLNPVAPDITAIVAAHLDALARYPDADEATDALAGVVGVSADRVLLTNGGAEAIALVAGALGEGWVDEPEFSLYRRHLTGVRPGAPRWRSDPHNPSGLLAGVGERAAVWDEAFYPLATGRWTSGRAEHGAIVVGSLTKLFACPGLRIGYVVAPRQAGAELIDALRVRQPQWSVNALATAALPELLAAADLPGWQAGVTGLRAQLVALLGDRGFCPTRSDANFVLVPHAPGLRDRLARHAVLVRDCASFGLPDGVRIAVPSHEGLERLSKALS